MGNLVGDSNDPGVAAVAGTHTAAAAAIIGRSDDGRGVLGLSTTGQGVWGASTNSTGVVGVSTTGQGVWGASTNSAGVVGASDGFNAVRGISHAAWHGAVVGINDNTSDQAGVGVYGESRATGVFGKSATWHGVFGYTDSTTGGQGVNGEGHTGVAGVGRTWVGVYGETRGSVNGPAGVWGEGGAGGFGVKGHARAPGAAGVAGYQLNNSGPGVYGKGNPAGFFEGDVVVTGDLRLSGADYAEDLTVADEAVLPGMVVVVGEDGLIRPCADEYDTRVAGVVSGARGVRPALVLDRHDGGMPVALMGKLWTFADASFSPIRCGDLLTTSVTAGHARAATDRGRAFGAVIGKALTSLASGTGMVRVLVNAT